MECFAGAQTSRGVGSRIRSRQQLRPGLSLGLTVTVILGSFALLACFLPVSPSLHAKTPFTVTDTRRRSLVSTQAQAQNLGLSEDQLPEDQQTRAHTLPLELSDVEAARQTRPDTRFKPLDAEGSGRGVGSHGPGGQQLDRPEIAPLLKILNTIDARGGGDGDGRSPDPIFSGRTPELSMTDRFGGWRLTEDVFRRAARHPSVSVVSEREPYILQHHGFVSPQEIEELMELAEGHFQRSGVVADKSQSDRRTSSGAWLSGGLRTDLVLDIQHRIHDWVGVPEEFGESLYVLRYLHGQKYDAHMDNCRHVDQEKNLTGSCTSFLRRAGGPEYGQGAGGVTGGDRMATVILYLRAPEQGGETMFPNAARPGSGPVEPDGRVSASLRATLTSGPCHNPDVLRLAPKAGDAVLFWDYTPGPDPARAVPDQHSLHGGCPVTVGEKFIATRWIRSTYYT